MDSSIPDTPAEIDAHVQLSETSYRQGYRDGASDVAHKLGYQIVTHDELPEPRFPFVGVILVCIAAYFAVTWIVRNAEQFPRVDRDA